MLSIMNVIINYILLHIHYSAYAYTLVLYQSEKDYKRIECEKTVTDRNDDEDDKDAM